MRKVGISQAEVDATKIVEDTDDFLVVPAIIAREGVFRHPEGMVYYPADELKKAVWTADGAWIVPKQHPDTLIVTSLEDIGGRVEKPFFCDKINGINAHLRFYKKLCEPQFIADVKSGARKDVSWGYFYDEDPTPGNWKGQHYDSARRNFLVNHVAAGVPVGRCSSPYCGIAVDELIRKVAVDPEVTENYVRIRVREPDLFVDGSFRTIVLSADQGIHAIVGKLKSDPNGSTVIQNYMFELAKGWTMEKAQAWVQDHKDQKATDSVTPTHADPLLEIERSRRLLDL